MMGILVYGLINSTVLTLMAIGFSLTFGISGMANFAYGAFYVLGAFGTWHLIHSLGFPYPLAVILALITNGLLGAALYWLVLFRIRGLVLSEVVATFGVGIGLLELFRSIGLTGHSYKLDTFIDGSMEVFGVFVDYQRLIIIGLGLLLIVFLWYFSHHTKTGLAFRGIAQDEYTALAFGIDSDKTAMLSLAIGCALAATVAVAVIPLSLLQVEDGNDILITALAVGIVGGMESVVGIVIASLIFGYIQIITATLFNPHYTIVVMLAAIILVLVIKPSGLFGKFKELEERV